MQSYDRLLDTLRTLLSPGGCAWDAEQDVRSMARYLIEESYEFYDAVAEDSSTGVIEELGDVLYVASFIALLAERDGTFTLAQVCDGAEEKMRRRHPHVFDPGGPKLDDADAVIRHWEKLKHGEAEEPTELPLSRALEKVPVHTPPLLRAVRVQEKAAHYHFDWPEVGGVLDKLEEETAELRRAVGEGRRDRIADELGDVLFSLANLARFLKMDPGQALIGTVKKFQERLRWMETRCVAGGVSLCDLNLPELEALWQKAKLQLENDAS
ncbi:MAG TPA: nucleoside triphosphate pyrophosphohydrolase [bacterium]|nr:nucleoside triphosphate pyrophosphohydrolase [bacterium]